MTGGVQLDLASWSNKDGRGFERGDDGVNLRRFREFDGRLPLMPSVPDLRWRIGDTSSVGECLLEAIDETFVLRRLGRD
jgi:hypothetical protein